MALGLSIKTSVPWQASQDVFNRSSIQPRNWRVLSQKGRNYVWETPYLGDTLPQKANSKCPVLHADPHKLCRISTDIAELNPVLAVVDPELMRTVPAKYTAYQGFDALFHNTEVMISHFVNVLSETVALSAIEYIAKYLPRAVKDGNGHMVSFLRPFAIVLES